MWTIQYDMFYKEVKFILPYFVLKQWKLEFKERGWANHFQEAVNLIKRRIWLSITPRWNIYHHQVMNIISCNPSKHLPQKTVHKNYKPTWKVHRFSVHVHLFSAPINAILYVPLYIQNRITLFDSFFSIWYIDLFSTKVFDFLFWSANVERCSWCETKHYTSKCWPIGCVTRA